MLLGTRSLPQYTLRLMLPSRSTYARSWGFCTSSHQPSTNASHIPVIRTLPQLRKWRNEARQRGLEVGCVPTMGALHEGHLSLVRISLERHPLTIMTSFINPMQFGPDEDFEAYPRQFDQDSSLLSTLSALCHPPRTVRKSGSPEKDECQSSHTPQTEYNENTDGPGAMLVVFAPDVKTMYPLQGELHDLSRHLGVEVNLKGFGHMMEGSSRPQFFKGVATVCTKLFNAIEPDHAYFGQKDIQQALLLRIMAQDLLLSHPSPSSIHIAPTIRSPSGLALSSRNTYLSSAELNVSSLLFRALKEGADFFSARIAPSQTVTGNCIVETSTAVIQEEQNNIKSSRGCDGSVELKLDYIELFDRHTLAPVRGEVAGKELVLAGALWVGRTRLIDNMLLGWDLRV